MEEMETALANAELESQLEDILPADAGDLALELTATGYTAWMEKFTSSQGLGRLFAGTEARQRGSEAPDGGLLQGGGGQRA